VVYACACAPLLGWINLGNRAGVGRAYLCLDGDRLGIRDGVGAGSFGNSRTLAIGVFGNSRVLARSLIWEFGRTLAHTQKTNLNVSCEFPVRSLRVSCEPTENANREQNPKITTRPKNTRPCNSGVSHTKREQTVNLKLTLKHAPKVDTHPKNCHT